MPIRTAVENGDELRLVVYWFAGRVAPADVIAAVGRALARITPGEPYGELLLFARDADLSDFDPGSLAMLYREVDALYRELRLGPRTSAAVIDHSLHAKLIMPLFNAFAQVGPGTDMGFELFTDVEPALQWLGVPAEDGMACIDRAVEG